MENDYDVVAVRYIQRNPVKCVFFYMEEMDHCSFLMVVIASSALSVPFCRCSRLILATLSWWFFRMSSMLAILSPYDLGGVVDRHDGMSSMDWLGPGGMPPSQLHHLVKRNHVGAIMVPSSSSAIEAMVAVVVSGG